eukprot:TRINITY_DN1911_c0_g1_i22.p1 TRINITY_DN1911_c0_g1~~TRINITY_DN1911_c0_g1_i22.p1  ORF type:complete len:219 (+),score=43.06 TRINITY_DN1911_c0_g1_i22:1104-1760(+)
MWFYWSVFFFPYFFFCPGTLNKNHHHHLFVVVVFVITTIVIVFVVVVVVVIIILLFFYQISLPPVGIPNEIISSYAETDKLFEKFSHVTLENGYKFGQITNNSRFSAELLLSFIHNKGKFVPQDFAFRLSSLLLKDSPSPEKCDQATLDAVNAINNGVPWYRSGAIVGNQNCAAVRSVCIGALCWNDHQLLTRVAVDQSSCTHNTSITRAGTNKWWCE